MSRGDEHNVQVIAGLQKRQFRRTVVFYCGLAAIPLGVICPCGLAAVVYQVAPEWSQSVALSSFFLPLVGLAAVLLMVVSGPRTKRELALAQVADALGLRITLKPRRDQLDFLTSFPLLKQYQLGLPVPGSGANMMEGDYKDRPLIAVDYSTLHNVPGSKPSVRAQTVAVFIEGFEAFPTFGVTPPMWGLTRLGQSIVGPSPGSFKVPGEKEFNQRFTTVGEDQDRILGCLTPEFIDLLLEDPRTFVEVHHGMFLMAYRHTIINAAEYEEFLRKANRIAKVLEKAGK